jgi:hypothetical protein
MLRRLTKNKKGRTAAAPVVFAWYSRFLPVLVFPDDVVDFLRNLCFIENFFEFVRHFLALRQNVGPFFEQREIEVLFTVFLFSDFKKQQAATDGYSEKEDKGLYENE